MEKIFRGTEVYLLLLKLEYHTHRMYGEMLSSYAFIIA